MWQQQPQQPFQQQHIHQQVVTSSDATRIDWKPSESDLEVEVEVMADCSAAIDFKDSTVGRQY